MKAPLGGAATGKSPVDRGKLGTKRQVLTDQRGAPVGVEVTGANRHDSQAVRTTLESIPVKRPASRAADEQHLTADKGYRLPGGQTHALAARLRGAHPEARRAACEAARQAQIQAEAVGGRRSGAGLHSL
ncbi:MAG: transposase [Pyrinomonadaceae bacterium]